MRAKRIASELRSTAKKLDPCFAANVLRLPATDAGIGGQAASLEFPPRLPWMIGWEHKHREAFGELPVPINCRLIETARLLKLGDIVNVIEVTFRRLQMPAHPEISSE